MKNSKTVYHSKMNKILLVDNYDSFTYNLAALLRTLYQGEVTVVRNDQWPVEDIIKMSPAAIVISPGPGTPADSGLSMEALNYFWDKLPIFGVCLGMQCINEFFGGATVRAPYPVHGKASSIRTTPSILYNGLPETITVARYHSLMIQHPHSELLITAYTDKDDVIMSFEHKTLPIYGVQYHPESFMTPEGAAIADNFLKEIK